MASKMRIYDHRAQQLWVCLEKTCDWLFPKLLKKLLFGFDAFLVKRRAGRPMDNSKTNSRRSEKLYRLLAQFQDSDQLRDWLWNRATIGDAWVLFCCFGLMQNYVADHRPGDELYDAIDESIDSDQPILFLARLAISHDVVFWKDFASRQTRDEP